MPRVCACSHAHPARSLTLGGVIFCFPSSTSSCASLWVRQLGRWLSRSSSAMVTHSLDSCHPISLASCAFKVCEHLTSALIAPTFFHNSTLPRAVSAGGPTKWPSVLWMRLRRHEHTFHAFIDTKKAFDSCWVEATLVRLCDFGVSGRLWHVLANFLCGTCPRSVWVALSLHLGSALALRKAGFSLPFFSICSTVSLSLFVQPFRCPPSSLLTLSSRVTLTASQTDVQVALDAVHA